MCGFVAVDVISLNLCESGKGTPLDGECLFLNTGLFSAIPEPHPGNRIFELLTSAFPKNAIEIVILWHSIYNKNVIIKP